MARTKLVGVRLDAVEAKRIEQRAEALGMNLSAYIRSLIEADMKRGGNADVLAKTGAEVALAGAMMIKKLLVHTMGDEKANAIEVSAREAAVGFVGSILERAKQ